MANEEALTIDGLAVNDSVTFGMVEFSAPVPRQRREWIGAADSEAQLLARNPLHENRTITAKITVAQQATMDLAHDKVLSILDKLQKASKYPDGISMTWAPATGTRTATFDLLAGEIVDLPIDWESGYLARSPTLTIEMTCKPYWRGTETLTSTASSSTPFVTLEVASVTGDVPALGRLIITDTASQSRRHVEWGLEGPLTYNSGTSLIVDSDSMVTSGFSGALATTSGAYDPNAAGTNVVLVTVPTNTRLAVCGTGNLSHVGTFRVKARAWCGSVNLGVRLSWRAGDGPLISNDWAYAPSPSTFCELDLGTITIPPVLAGTQRWTGQIEALGPNEVPPGLHVDYLTLVPVSDGYGKSRAVYSFTPGSVVGYDNFTSTTAGSALNARSAPTGGSWATSGSATDFAFADDLSGEQVKRSTSSDTGPRWAILGTSNYTDTEVATGAARTNFGSGILELGVVARWTDSSNYLRLVAQRDAAANRTLYLVQRVAGTDTTLASTSIPNSWFIGSFNTLRLLVYASGRAIGTFVSPSGVLLGTVEASSTALATGGTLATGKPGIYDYNATATAVPRYYDDFRVSTPVAEPIALYSGRNMQIRHDDVIRQDSTGTYTGRPPSYRGGRFLLPVGTSRVLVKARRNDIESAVDDNVTDATQVQVGWTPRGLALPR